jgi:hypothetical protein
MHEKVQGTFKSCGLPNFKIYGFKTVHSEAIHGFQVFFRFIIKLSKNCYDNENLVSIVLFRNQLILPNLYWKGIGGLVSSWNDKNEKKLKMLSLQVGNIAIYEFFVFNYNIFILTSRHQNI